MTAKTSTYTPGRLSLQTVRGSYQRPAYLIDDQARIILEARGDQLEPRGPSIGEAEANAVRVARLWNALQGIANPEAIAMAIGILRDIAQFVSAGDDDVPFKVMLEDAKYALRSLDGEQGQ